MLKEKSSQIKINIYHSYLLKIHSDDLKSENKHVSYFQDNACKTMKSLHITPLIASCSRQPNDADLSREQLTLRY